MSGISLTTALITGAKAGIQDSAASLSTTVNNQYFIEFALIFIGFFVVVGWIRFVFYKKKSNIGSLDSGGKERKWAESQSMASYLAARDKEQRR